MKGNSVTILVFNFYSIIYKMIFFHVFFMQMVSSLCFDLEIEGALHISKDLMRRFGDELPLELKALEGPIVGPPSKQLVQLMAANPLETVQRNKMTSEPIGNKPSDKNEKGPETFKMVSITHKTIDKPDQNKTIVKDDEFKATMKHQLSKTGSLRLKVLASFIKNQLSSYADITTILKKATNNYESAVELYYVFISKTPMKNVGKEFVVLDMIETANQILLNIAKKLLDDIIAETNAEKSTVEMSYLLDKIKNTVLKEKQDQFRHVCHTLHVCRPFPGFCDHVADLISEILQLDDGHLKYIFESYEETISVKRLFFETITNANVYALIRLKLKDSHLKIGFMKEVLSMLRAVITQRYKVIRSDSLVVKMKTKAVRILLDLIDKAFEVNDDELNSIEIQNTINGYQKWVAGERKDLNEITKKFFFNAVEILNYSWSKDSKEEVKVLTDIIFTGRTNNTAVYDYLFKKGSSLIRNEQLNVHSD